MMGGERAEAGAKDVHNSYLVALYIHTQAITAPSTCFVGILALGWPLVLS